LIRAEGGEEWEGRGRGRGKERLKAYMGFIREEKEYSLRGLGA
jgi:hypothetical protein